METVREESIQMSVEDSRGVMDDRDTMVDYDTIHDIIQFWCGSGILDDNEKASFRDAGETMMNMLLQHDARYLAMMRRYDDYSGTDKYGEQ